METLVASVVSIMENLLSNDLGDMSKEGVTKWRIKRLRKRIKKWCNRYALSHDGTILTEGRFAHFLEFQNPLREIFCYAQAPTVGVSEEEFLTYMVSKAQRDVEGSVGVNEQVEIKHFYKDIMKQINEFWISLLSLSERTILHNNAVNTAKVLSIVSEMGTDIKNSITNHLLLSQLSETDAVAIFHALNDRYWDGKFQEIIDFYPAIEGKSKDLVLWIKLSLRLAMLNAPFVINSSEYQNIESHELHDDIIRKTLIFSTLENDLDSIITDAYEEGLKKIAGRIKDGDFSIIYSKSLEKKNHVSLLGIKINETYNSEIWLLKRLLIINLIFKPYQGISDSMKSVLGEESDYLMDLIILRNMIEERFQNDKGDEVMRKETFEAIWGRKTIYFTSCPPIQDIFWNMCVSYHIINDKEKLHTVLCEIPNEICDRLAIKDSLYMAHIELGDVDYCEVLDYCKKTGKYWLINNYYAGLNDPNKVVSLIDQDKELLLSNEMIFFDYVRALHFINEEGKEQAVLAEYEEDYSEFIEFWIHRIEIEKDEKSVEKLENLWMSNKLKYYSPIAESTVAEIFFKWKKYDSCIEVVKALETKVMVTMQDKKLKIMSLNMLGKKVEALSLLKSIFNMEELDEFVVNNIILLSLDLKRTIEDDVLSVAKTINSAYSLMLVAKVCERENRKDEARNWYRRSLILNKEGNDIIFGNYWFFSVLDTSSAEMTILGVDEDTAVYVKNTETNTVEVYCICSRDYLPNDPYDWNNTLHISMDTAVKYGLLRRRTGDKLIICGKDYEIIDIIPLECFYDRFCMTRMIEGKYVKTCQVPMTEDRETKVNLFTEWLKDNVGDDSAKDEAFQDYSDFSKIPLTLYALNRFSRLSYGQFVICLFEDKNIIVREEYDFNKENAVKSQNGYVLAFSAIVLLYTLRIDPELVVKANAHIPKSVVVALKEEREAILNMYNRETVASMGLVYGKLFVNQADEEEKSKWMKHAVELLDYCERLPQIENESSISLDIISESDVMSLYGIVDYDAILICSAKDMTLVSIEQFLSSLSSIPEIKITSINALEFIQTINLSKTTLLDYMTRMVNFRLINIINHEVLFNIASTDNKNASADLLSAWKMFLQEVDKTRGKYREILQLELTLAGKKVLDQGADVSNPFMRIYSSLVMKLNSLKYTYWVNGNGELVLGTVRESYEDVAE